MNSCSPPTQPIDSTSSAHVFRRQSPVSRGGRAGSATHPGVFASCAMSSAKTLSESSFCHKRRRPKLPPPRERLRQKIITLRKQNSSVYDILGCPGSEWGKAESGLDLDDSQGGGIRSSPETARRRTARNDSTQCCGRGRRRKARPVRAHVSERRWAACSCSFRTLPRSLSTRCWPMPSSQARR